MSFLEKLKRKIKREKEKKEKPVLKKPEKAKPVSEKKKPVVSPPVKAKQSPIAPQLLKEPHITEKATNLTEQDHYVFRVARRANKTEVKKAVQDIYGVNVVKVRTINVPSRPRRLGRFEGRKPGYKKAIVSLKPGQSIELLPR